MSKWFKESTDPGSKTAERVAILRAGESMKPEGERICFDPYAIHFISPGILEWATHNPEEVRAMQEKTDRLVPGLDNSVIARVRYFDDLISRSIDEGLEQLVILGAGYDSRPYRIDGLKKIKTFEVDHPATQAMKIEKIKKIFGLLPDHVVYVPADLATDDLGQKLLENGYDRSLKTIFIMEGLLMYLTPETVDEILSFIVENSEKESAILFDYYPQSVVDGSCELEVGKNIHNQLMQLGEPLKFGIDDDMIEEFLSSRGFSQVHNVTSGDLKRTYFQGINKDRTVCSQLYFAYAVKEKC
jgi:methyltransferase (TIGR00027 family)